FRFQVQCGEGKAAARPGAGYDFAGQDERPAEETCGVGDIAGGDFAADYGAGDNFFLERYGRDYFDGEPMMRAEFSQLCYVAGLLVAEAKIFPYEHSAYMKAAHED